MRRLFVLAVVWGFSFLFIKVAGEGMTPPTVAGGRVALGALTLMVVLRIQGAALPRDLGTWRQFAVTGLFASALPFTALAWGEERITSALASVLNATTPLFTALVAAVIARERLRPVQVGGLATGLAGVAIAAGLGRSDLSGGVITGSLAPLFGAFCYGVAFVYVQRNMLHLPPTVAAAGQLTVAAAILAPVALATSLVDGFDATPTRLLSLLLLGVAGTGVAMMIHYGVVADLGATRAALVTYLVPVVAITAGLAVLDERFTWRLPVGGVVVLASVAAVHGTLRVPRRLPLRPAGAPVILLVALLVLGACGGDPDASDGDGGGTSSATTTSSEAGTTSPASAGCEPEVTEAIDPRSTQHVLPGTEPPDYQTDPPTSGPHDSRPLDQPVQSEPIPNHRQVGQLENGFVLFQHRDLEPEEQAALEGLAGEDVVVAPNPDLPARVVATAWVTKMLCHDVDRDAVTALVAFADAHGGNGPGGHSPG